jgi:hypothetical protein
MISRAFAIVIAVLCVTLPAFADDAAPENDAGRYTFTKVADGFVRLDMKTGEVALCGKRTVGWACQTAPEDRAVLENEIARLRSENAALKKDLLVHGLPLPTGTLPEPPVLRDGDRTVHLPINPHFDRVVTFVNDVWHRLVEAIAKVQKQVLNKS